MLAKERKATGSHYTPTLLANFVASQIVQSWNKTKQRIRILDPAIGDGELLLALVGELHKRNFYNFEAFAFDTNKDALELADFRIKQKFQNVNLSLKSDDFLDFVLDKYWFSCDLSQQHDIEPFDLVISNPPYVRTQVMGAQKAQILARQFCLSGRVDLSFAFIKSIAKVLRLGGIAGIIVSNRFMSTKSGAQVRQSILKEFQIIRIWDFGDTKLFEAAVLPAVLLLRRSSKTQKETRTKLTTIYSIDHGNPVYQSRNVIDALRYDGITRNADGRLFSVQHGELDHGNKPNDVWRISTTDKDEWLNTVEKNTFCTFGDLGKIRVGVKTTADKIFIRSDWDDLPPDQQPEAELLRLVTTHHIAQRYKPLTLTKRILYPHKTVNGMRIVVNLDEFPQAANYLGKHRNILERRRYLIDAGRKWYEIWVPQDPQAWNLPKIVFWDIAKEPIFWVDLGGSVVNGDCYWFARKDSSQIDLFWLALAVGNSRFIESFYDHKFNNKLYAGRRRFMTQYVEQFPLPDPNTKLSKKIIDIAKKAFSSSDIAHTKSLEKEIDTLIWKVFGFGFEEVLW